MAESHHPDSLLIEVPLADIREATRQAVRQSFAGPEYGGRQGGVGYEAVRRLVADWINFHLHDEVESLVTETVKLALPGVVRAIVGKELEELVRKAFRDLKKGGRLTDEAQLLLKQSEGGDRD